MPHITTHIIDGLVATGEFPEADCQKMLAIKAKHEHPCGWLDALWIAARVFSRLRADDHA